MYLGKSEIKRRIASEGLLKNCDIENVQGAGYDMCIDKLFLINSPAFLGVKERRLPSLNEVEGKVFLLSPGSYYLCLTKESVSMPEDLVAFLQPRSTLFRCGVSLRNAVIDPGYVGQLTIGIKNDGGQEFKLEKGSRIAQIVFSELKGGSSSYNGKYQGGKVV